MILIRIESFISNSKTEEEATSSNNTKITIPKIHYAYNESKSLLSFLERAFLLEQPLAKKIFERIKQVKQTNDQRLKRLEHVLLEEIIFLCTHKKELTSDRDLAEKYVILVRQFQPLVEEGLSFDKSGNPEYVKARHILK